MGKDLKGKSLDMGISQRKDGFYVGRYTTRNGERKQKVFQKYHECRKWLADARYEDEHCTLDAGSRMTVDTWYEYWMSVKERTLRVTTISGYVDRYNGDIKPVIGNLQLQDVTTAHCQNILFQMADKGYARGTIQTTKLVLHNLFETAVQHNLLYRNPCNSAVKANIGKPTRARKPLTVTEQKIFLKAITGNKFEMQFRLLMQTGMRVGEMEALRWEDVDFRKKEIAVNHTLNYSAEREEKMWLGEPKSASGKRVIPMTQEAERILKEKWIHRDECEIVNMRWKGIIFHDKNGRPMMEYYYTHELKDICEKAKMRKISTHVLRHTFATRCIEAGMNPKTLQTILGHSDVSITLNRYVHTTEDYKHDEMEMVEKNLNIM